MLGTASSITVLELSHLILHSQTNLSSLHCLTTLLRSAAISVLAREAKGSAARSWPQSCNPSFMQDLYGGEEHMLWHLEDINSIVSTETKGKTCTRQTSSSSIAKEMMTTGQEH